MEFVSDDLQGAAGAAEPAAGDDTGQWDLDYQTFRHGRLERVQDSARQWLGTITALLGLFSAAIVVGGGNSVSDLSSTWRRVVFFAAVLVYALAFYSVGIGAAATFGGLGLRPPNVNDLDSYIERETGKADAAVDVARYYRNAAHRARPEQAAAQLELALAAEQQISLRRHQVLLAQARKKQLESVRERKVLAGVAVVSSWWHTFWGSNAPNGDAFDYRFNYERQADKRRARLHKSRVFGILAAALSGVLAMTLLWQHTLTQSTPALSILVVHNGTVSCETARSPSAGSATFPGAGVTQVTVVPNC